MKKIYKFFLVLLTVLFTSGVVLAQTLLYEDDFESYTTGGYVAEQNPDWWMTWSGGTGGGEDGIISETFSHSPTKSVLIDETGGATDLLWLLGDKTSDIYNVSFWMYIPSGFCGYYNFQHFEAPGVEWAIEMYFHTDGSTKFIIAGDEIVMNYNHDTWFFMEHIIDLDSEIAQAYIDGTLITEWLWSLQSSGAAGANQLGGIDFFAGADAANPSDVPKYYFDDVKYTQGDIPPGPIITVDPDHFDVSLEIGQTDMDYLTVGNVGEEDLIYTISIECPDDWLTVSPSSGTIVPDDTDIIDVTFDAIGLDVGIYYATIIIESNDFLNPEVNIPVSLTVSSAPHFNFEGGDPSSPLWTIYIGGAMLEEVDLVAGDEIGIFDGDLLVGAFMLEQVCTPENQFENDLTAFSVLVTGLGYEGGNPYFFKCWDASEELEVDNFEIELFNPYGDAYTGDVFPYDDGEYSIVALDFYSSSASQTFNLSFGFQFISSGVNPENPDMLVVMADVLNENLDFARNSLGQTLRKIGPNWVNGIGDWVVDEGYLVKMYADDSFTINGTLVNPSTPIPVEAGFQFVSYFPDTPMNALDAFSTIIGDDLDFVRNSQGQTLRKIGPNWVNGIGDCQSGEGYLVKMFADGEIIYILGAKSSGKITLLPVNIILQSGNPAEAVYTLYVKGLDVGDEVAAFDGEKLVGAVKINSKNALENELPVFSALINGQGYESGNPITLKIWSENKLIPTDFIMEAIYDSYVSDVYPDEDGKYSVVNITKGSSPEAEGLIRIFPNPASDFINIVSSVEIQNVSIFNFIGQSVYYGNEIKISTNNFESGVYIVKIETVNGIETQKITIK